MGLLTPLYLAGLLAIGLPLVFHLIRRTPRESRAQQGESEQHAPDHEEPAQADPGVFEEGEQGEEMTHLVKAP